jgi:hypothetical protein
MEKKNKKPFGHTELNPTELAEDLAQKHGKILNISTDDKGQQTIKIQEHRKENNNLPLDNDY